ncbi:glycosyltransferase family 2 protein [Pedobacter arcticus]|uniref:glycosyltransferase family 2 protein n=1 Tax=Pedobacter arcticus TaxID=752140 RepID=UPI0002F2A1A4|nr:glycosyltransferase family 2 protein [Pedobacter arcticus]
MQISIVTATFNSEDFIADAIKSYQDQILCDKELVVIDGKSSDRTLEILKQNNSAIATLISEPDKGIYDALNKGIGLANGDIIGILHSDDFLAHNEVLALVNKKFAENPNLDAVYGDLQYVNRQDPNKVIRHWKSGEYHLNNFKKGWMPPHPALFIRKDCFNKFGAYNLAYKSAADYDLILRFLFKNQIKVAYIPQVLVKMRVGGLSNKSLKNRINANREDRLALKLNGVPNPLWVSVLKPLSKIGQFLR